MPYSLLSPFQPRQTKNGAILSRVEEVMASGLLGLTQINEEPAPVEIPRVKCSAAPPLSLIGVALAVFLGNVLTAIFGAIMYALLK